MAGLQGLLVTGVIFSTANDPQNGPQMIDNGAHYLWSGDHLQY